MIPKHNSKVDIFDFPKITCICLNDSIDGFRCVEKHKIYTCQAHPKSLYCAVWENDNYKGVHKKDIFIPLAEWREEQINSILND